LASRIQYGRAYRSAGSMVDERDEIGEVLELVASQDDARIQKEHLRSLLTGERPIYDVDQRPELECIRLPRPDASGDNMSVGALAKRRGIQSGQGGSERT